MDIAVLQIRNRTNLFVSGAYKIQMNHASEPETAHDNTRTEIHGNFVQKKLESYALMYANLTLGLSQTMCELDCF
jgi:hypothetical protein